MNKFVIIEEICGIFFDSFNFLNFILFLGFSMRLVKYLFRLLMYINLSNGVFKEN